MKAQDIIDKLQKDIRFLTRPVADDLVSWIDEAQKEIVNFFKWSWLKVEVSTSLPIGNPTTYVDLTLPLNGDSKQDVDYMLWVKDYSGARELYPVEEQPLNCGASGPLFYQLMPDKLRFYPGNAAIADLRYKYVRKLYDVEDEDNSLLIPDDFNIVINPMVLEKIYRSVDDTRAREFHDLGLFALIEKKRIDIRRNPPRFIKPDYATQV